MILLTGSIVLTVSVTPKEEQKLLVHPFDPHLVKPGRWVEIYQR